MKKLNLTTLHFTAEYFHRKMKPSILAHARKNFYHDMHKVGHNPDILIDSNGNICLGKASGKSKTINLGVPLNYFN